MNLNTFSYITNRKIFLCVENLVISTVEESGIEKVITDDIDKNSQPCFE